MFFIKNRESNLGIKKRAVERKLTLGPVSAKVLFFIILAAFATFYLANQSQMMKRRVETSDLGQQVKDQQDEVDQLKMESDRYKTLSQAQEKANEKGMESAGQ